MLNIFIFLFNRGGRSANKFRKKKNPKICGLTNLLRLADIPQIGQPADLRFKDPIFFAIRGPHFFANLELPQICKYIIYLLINIGLNALLYFVQNKKFI
jgi:hypothetical protein